MLQPWPPDYNSVLLRRAQRIEEVRLNPFVMIPALKQHYKENPLDFIEHWCVTYDPRNRSPLPKILPFILFDKQKEFIECLYESFISRQSVLTEKCRDMGATWECCGFTTWLWLFHSESTIGWGSRKEEYVDKKGDPKAIFPKIRQIIEWLPDFLMPIGFAMDQHATYMKIINPENGSVISGEAGDAQGRGGRTSIYFKDESAHYERPELIEAALGDNTDVQIDISSVNGTNNVFYRKRQAGEVWHKGHTIERGVTRVFIFDWRDHPAKTQEWYNERRSRAEREGLLHIFAQEVERNYSSSVDRLVINPVWIEAAIDAHKKLNFVASGDKVAACDIADSGGDKNAITIRHGVIVRYADCWGGEASACAQAAIPLCVEYGVKYMAFDSVGVGAGFKVEINNMKERGGFPKFLRVLPWNGGASVVDPDDNIIAFDSQSPTNEDQYANLKAQSWFRVRTRFYKTFRAVCHGDKYGVDELISLDSTIPRIHELKNELSQAQYKQAMNGKTLIDKKPDGASSPNIADSLIMCFNHNVDGFSILDVI